MGTASEHNWVLQAHLARATGGWGLVWYDESVVTEPDGSFEALSIAVGKRVAPDISVALGTKAAENSLSLSNEVGASILPLYAYCLYTSVMPRPGSRVVYAFVGACAWSNDHDHDFVRAGIGVSATWWAITPGIEVQWRRDAPFREYPTDTFSITATLGLGGWYSF